MGEKEKFKLTIKMTKEHPKLYKALLIITYIILFPLVIIVAILEKLGELSDIIGNILYKIRMFIIKLVFKCIYNKSK